MSFFAAGVFTAEYVVTLSVEETVSVNEYEEEYRSIEVGGNTPVEVEKLLLSEDNSEVEVRTRTINSEEYDDAYEYNGTIYLLEWSERFSVFGYELG
jgi:hypothetical protein